MIRPDTDELIAFLDSLAKLDPVAMGKLVSHRVGCTSALIDHPTVQSRVSPPFSASVSILGILNGYAGTIESGRYEGWGPIAAILEADGRVTGFRRTDLPENGKALMK